MKEVDVLRGVMCDYVIRQYGTWIKDRHLWVRRSLFLSFLVFFLMVDDTRSCLNTAPVEVWPTISGYANASLQSRKLRRFAGTSSA